jgi:hypothetical protein
MFDYRYHALSLAAVLLALALGVLLGVAIGDSSLVSSAKSGIVHNLSSEVDQARRQSDQLHEKLADEEAFANGIYPLAMHELLAGRSVGLLFLGGSSDQINSLVRTSVTQAGGQVATVVAVREPLDVEGIDREAAGTHYASLATSPQLVQRFGELVGRQLVSGGALVNRELLSRVRSSLLSAFDGQLTRLEGLIVVRAHPDDMSSEQEATVEAFETGVIAGATAVGVPVVGVEVSDTQPSQIPWYQSKGISSVDNLDTQAGQAALVYALAGDSGTFGEKSTADSLLPSATSTSGAP